MPEEIKTSGKIDVQDVRHFTFDRPVQDNTLDMDLAFSDEEIGHAMRFAAMTYNDMAPQCHTVDPTSLPFGGCFLHGIAYHLYLGKLQQLMRNDIDYSAGNITVDLNQRRIKHIQAVLLPLFKAEFEKLAFDQKVAINISHGYRAF